MDQPPDPPEIVGGRIHSLRVAMGYTDYGGQGRFAKFVGITAQALSNYEVGERLPKISELAKFRSRTGATYEWLLHGTVGGMPHDLLQKIEAVPAPRGGSSRRA